MRFRIMQNLIHVVNFEDLIIRRKILFRNTLQCAAHFAIIYMQSLLFRLFALKTCPSAPIERKFKFVVV